MHNHLKNIILLMAIGLAGVNLTACVSDTADTGQTPPWPVVAPQNNVQKQKLYHYLLNEQGINVVNVGETRTIVIASDRLFVPGSANFNTHYASSLKVIAQLVNSGDPTRVAVTAYTDQSGDVARALTEKQAQKVLDYLQKSGANTRLIYARGYGNLNQVTFDKEKSSFNRRVEIKFQVHQE